VCEHRGERPVVAVDTSECGETNRHVSFSCRAPREGCPKGAPTWPRAGAKRARIGFWEHAYPFAHVIPVT
jgi:hypothetical protein